MRLFAGALLCASLFASPLSREFDDNLLAFYAPFDLFLRHYQGCLDSGPVVPSVLNVIVTRLRLDTLRFVLVCCTDVLLLAISRQSCGSRFLTTAPEV